MLSSEEDTSSILILLVQIHLVIFSTIFETDDRRETGIKAPLTKMGHDCLGDCILHET
jgi:hypothetical protein